MELSTSGEFTGTDPETLTSWILSQQHLNAPHARGSLTMLLNAVAVSCKFISTAVRKAGLAGVLGMAGSANIQGEDQKKLDVLANEVFTNVLRKSGQCAVLVSEEDELPVIVEDKLRGNYCVVFDPLDGSSNIDCGVTIGTIFGIYRRQQGSQGDVSDVLRPGREMAAAGYCVYGSSCMLVLSCGRGVAAFTLDPLLGEFLLTSPSLRVPRTGRIYSVNEGNASMWDPAVTEYVRRCKFPETGRPKSLRYVGSMVADVHRTILYGGSFLYPPDKKSPEGKLRVLYECFPIAYLVEQAGGAATNGTTRILDLQPADIHQRSPIFLGSAEDVAEITALYQSHLAA